MMTRLLATFRRFAREQRRDIWVLGLSLSFAPLMVLIYWMMTGSGGSTSYGVLVINRDIPVMLADGTTLAAGEGIITAMRQIQYQNGSPILKVTEIDDQPQAENRLRNRQATALVIIPPGLSAALADFQSGDNSASTEVIFSGDLSNPLYTVASVIAITAADNYVYAYSQSKRPVEWIEMPLGASAARSEFENYVPGLLILSVILVLFQAAMAPAREIESGTLLRLRLTRLNSFEYLAGNALWLGFISLISLLLTFVVAYVLGFRSQGSLWVAFLIGALTSLSIIGVGLIVACFSKTVSQAFVIANFPFGFLMFLTGAALPLPRHEFITIAGRGIAIYDLLPPTHAVIALNKIFTLGANLNDVYFEIVALILLSLLYFLVGVWTFQRTQMRVT